LALNVRNSEPYIEKEAGTLIQQTLVYMW